MKKTAGVLLLTAMIVSSCGNSKAKNEQGTYARDNIMSSAGEQPKTAEADQMSAMRENTEAASSAGLTDTGVIRGGTVFLNKADFLRKVWNYEKSPQQWVFLGERPAIIDFYADWCGPCKIAGPILEEVSYQFAGQVDFYKIDTQREQELASVFGIQGIPAFLYIPKTGKPSITSGIARSKDETRQMFVDNINNLLLKVK